jgi:hypothetical protein
MLTGSKDVDMQLTKVELPGVVHSSLFDRYKTTGDAPHRYHEAGCVCFLWTQENMAHDVGNFLEILCLLRLYIENVML